MAKRSNPVRKHNTKPVRQPSAGENLREEILILRELMRKVLEHLNDDPSMNELLRVLEGVGRTGTRLATLVKLQEQLDEHQAAGSSMVDDMQELIRRMS